MNIFTKSHALQYVNTEYKTIQDQMLIPWA